MNILITGIHGFVGSNLVRALMIDNTIYGLDIISEMKEGVKKTFTWEDLERAELPQVDAIIHLAGKAHDTKTTTQTDIYFQINTVLTQKILDYFLQSTAKKFIFFSSVKAVADFVPGDILTEDTIPHPVGPYGWSKMKAEEYIKKKFDINNCNSEKQVYILRPSMIHGPGNKGNLNLLYMVVKRGFPWPLGSFENKRSFTSIDNLCYIITNLLTKNIISGIYQIADDEALSTNELIKIMCEVMDRKSHILNIPRKFMFFGARMGGVLHLPLNTERLRKLTENYVVSNQKIKKVLNIQILPMSVTDGLIKTLKSFGNSNKN